MKLTRISIGIVVWLASTVSPALTFAAESASEMEEVVVTSRRRDESQQDVPLSVTAWALCVNLIPYST